MKLSEFLNKQITPFMFGVIFSRIMHKKEFFIFYASFRKSKKIEKNINSSVALNLLETYKKLTNIDEWYIKRNSETSVEICLKIENDIKLSEDELQQNIYDKLWISSWFKEHEFNNEKRMFISGFMESRGSIDTSRKYITQDYYYSNQNELKRAQILCERLNIPHSYLDINPRDLQPEFVNNINRRNTQLRIKLEYYSSTIGIFNNYKSEIINEIYKWKIKTVDENNFTFFDVKLPKENFQFSFLKMLNYYSSNIYGKELDKEIITKIRKELGLNQKEKDKDKTYRSSILKKFFDEISPNKCGLCGEEKTFPKKDKKEYFEIHHVISLHNDPNVLDNIDNLVKLCPNCHTMLKKGRSTFEFQVEGILKILNNYKEIYEFTSNYLNVKDYFELAQKIQELLG